MPRRAPEQTSTEKTTGNHRLEAEFEVMREEIAWFETLDEETVERIADTAPLDTPEFEYASAELRRRGEARQTVNDRVVAPAPRATAHASGPAVAPESERVRAWRLARLVAGGYGEDAAAVLASSRDVDLHRALALVAEGCPTETALRILL